jgi:hypothetical protein
VCEKSGYVAGALLFDITFGTNALGLKLGAFTTVGPDGSTRVLGAVLTLREDAESFTWARGDRDSATASRREERPQAAIVRSYGRAAAHANQLADVASAGAALAEDTLGGLIDTDGIQLFNTQFKGRLKYVRAVCVLTEIHGNWDDDEHMSSACHSGPNANTTDADPRRRRPRRRGMALQDSG